MARFSPSASTLTTASWPRYSTSMRRSSIGPMYSATTSSAISRNDTWVRTEAGTSRRANTTRSSTVCAARSTVRRTTSAVFR